MNLDAHIKRNAAQLERVGEAIDRAGDVHEAKGFFGSSRSQAKVLFQLAKFGVELMRTAPHAAEYLTRLRDEDEARATQETALNSDLCPRTGEACASRGACVAAKLSAASESSKHPDGFAAIAPFGGAVYVGGKEAQSANRKIVAMANVILEKSCGTRECIVDSSLELSEYDLLGQAMGSSVLSAEQAEISI